MNKNDLVGQVAQDTGLSKVDAARAVDSVFDIKTVLCEICDGIAKGYGVVLLRV